MLNKCSDSVERVYKNVDHFLQKCFLYERKCRVKTRINITKHKRKIKKMKEKRKTNKK